MAARGIPFTEKEYRRRYQLGDREGVGLFLAAGMHPDAGAVAGSTALTFAKDVEMAGLLLDAGADPNSRGPDGATPLLRAIVIGDEALVARLLAAGADPSAADAIGRTPLVLATAMSFDDIADRLVAAGATPPTRSTVPADLLRSYAGIYRGGGNDVRVSLDRGRLFLSSITPSHGIYERELLPIDRNTFYREDDPAAVPFRFELDGEGEIAGLRDLSTDLVYLPVESEDSASDPTD